MADESRLEDYVAWVTMPDGARLHTADVRLETDHRGRHRASGIRYRSDWLGRSQSYSVNPIHAPLDPDPMEWRTREIPAVLDEVLPGRWERAVQQRVWGEKGDVDDLHAILGATRHSWRVGALEILPAGMESPELRPSVRLEDLESIAEEADRIHQHQAPEIQALIRIQAGSSVGGARPKVLFEDDGAWLAKFTRPDDAFNHVRTEHACLLLARRAGIAVPDSRVIADGRFEALAVRRFDVTPAGGRWGLVSANALLKDPETQADRQHPHYEDLIELIRRFSTRPAEDLAQLYALMLFNEAINNRDDHLKNFSFLQGPGLFRLSPAYDLVPSEAMGAYPQLDFDYSPYFPCLDTPEALAAAKKFSLAPSEARAINQALADALNEIGQVMDEAELPPRECRFLGQRLPPRFRAG